MTLETLQIADYLVIGLFFCVILGISAYYSRRASQGANEFFLSGRNLPWYLAGTAMVATTFAADTPLAVTELVVKYGVSGNWVWWNMAIGGLFTTFFFARLWRRSEVNTDLEFIELRYSGKKAAVLRGFRAIYLGLLLNAVVLGWVHKAMEKIFHVIFPGVNSFLLVTILAIVIAGYAAVSGLVGTIRTDSFQFIFAIVGCIILAVLVVRIPEVGGLKGLTEKLPHGATNFFPTIAMDGIGGAASGFFSISMGAFVAFVGVQWWSSWYPGADPGGGGYIAQRMLSAKNEKHSFLATLWFNVAHYTIRPWPWILVALCAIVLLPMASNLETLQVQSPENYILAEKRFEGEALSTSEAALSEHSDFDLYYETYENTRDPGLLYPKLMLAYLPTGILGLLVAVFLAAYMSTVASQLNWGSSYLFNDFYLRFIKSDGSAKHNLAVSRGLIILMILFSLIVTHYFLTSVSGAWLFILNTSAGMGAVLILRWYWWRVSAWSEIASMIAPLIIYPVSQYFFELEPPITLYPTVIGTTIVWLVVTYLTPPEDEKTLIAFVQKVKPGGIGWKRFAKFQVDHKQSFSKLFVNWGSSVVAIYSMMYAMGMFLFQEFIKGGVAMVVCTISVVILLKNLNNDGTD